MLHGTCSLPCVGVTVLAALSYLAVQNHRDRFVTGGRRRVGWRHCAVVERMAEPLPYQSHRDGVRATAFSRSKIT